MTNTTKEHRTGLYPLSSVQNRFWFMESMEGSISANNNPLDYRVSGDLDIPLLEQSLRFLVLRHEALRTLFPNGTGNPSQKILDRMDCTLHLSDLSEKDKDEQEKIIFMHSRDNATRKFNFGEGPLFHFELLILGNKEYIFLISFHHIISDAGSIDIFLEELKTVYASLQDHKEIDLPELTYSYKDYALDESRWLNSDEYLQKLSYWRTELSGAPEMMNLPLDFTRPRIQTFNGDEFHFTIDRPLRERMAELARNQGASLSAFLLASFGVLLNRYSMQDDIVVGVPFANRNREELLPLVGVLINTLPIRLSFPEGDTFAKLLGNVRNKFLHAFDNMEVPFERLVDELKVKRLPNVNPVFQVLYNYLTVTHREIGLPGLTMTLQDGVRKYSQVDLTLTVHDEANRLHCILQYNTELFNQETIARLSGHLVTILEAVTATDNITVQRIPLLTQDEAGRILGSWNNTAVDYPANKCLHQMFEEQAKLTPDLIAIADHKSELTYRDLNERANRLAHFLSEKGVAGNTAVAVFMERTAEMIAALLAVSKTGGTYLPLDPIFPKARLESILNDARPLLVISQSSLLNSLPVTGTETLLYDDDTRWQQESPENLPLGNADGNAYILYTSGSTGKPKGLPIRHHSVVNLVTAFSGLLKVNSVDVLLAVTTVSFDIAQLEIYLPLFNGGKLVIAPQEVGMDMELLKGMMQESGATLFQATPVTYTMLLRHGWEGNPSLRALVGGEALQKDLGRDLVPLCKEVWNCYGPTETTIWSSVKKLEAGDGEGEGFISIGRPLANNTFYVLSQGLMAVPAGIPGELYIGGAGVSAGYLNLPELTAEKFLANPFSQTSGNTIYKTGDIVKFLPDGNLVFLGRADSQVKIRGFRIEPGEIETILSQCMGIREAVVTVFENTRGEKMLAAYYTKSGNESPDPQRIRQALKTRLPDYMIPSVFIEMERLPLTTNNKVDRNALPKPEPLDGSLTSQYAKPVTPTEKTLARIWESILHIERVGIHDVFFDVGGHSMIAVTMIRMIEKEFGTKLPLAAVFDLNTIHLLAEKIDHSAVQPGSRSPEITQPYSPPRKTNFLRMLFKTTDKQTHLTQQ
jgi:amino acid adenylation domain-containing protein